MNLYGSRLVMSRAALDSRSRHVLLGPTRLTIFEQAAHALCLILHFLLRSLASQRTLIPDLLSCLPHRNQKSTRSVRASHIVLSYKPDVDTRTIIRDCYHQTAPHHDAMDFGFSPSQSPRQSSSYPGGQYFDSTSEGSGPDSPQVSSFFQKRRRLVC